LIYLRSLEKYFIQSQRCEFYSLSEIFLFSWNFC